MANAIPSVSACIFLGNTDKLFPYAGANLRSRSKKVEANNDGSIMFVTKDNRAFFVDAEKGATEEAIRVKGIVSPDGLMIAIGIVPTTREITRGEKAGQMELVFCSVGDITQEDADILFKHQMEFGIPTDAEKAAKRDRLSARLTNPVSTVKI